MKYFYALTLAITMIACKEAPKNAEENRIGMGVTNDTLIYPEEVHFKNIQQVTFGGDNAEAYWSFDDKQF